MRCAEVRTLIKAAGRIKDLTAVYLTTLRVWLQDENTDMARTMAVLDGHLLRIEGLAEHISGRSSGSR